MESSSAKKTTGLNSTVQELIMFYIKENYKQYIKEKNIDKIPTSELKQVISTMYTEKKQHLRVFLKSSLKQITKDEYPGDIVVDGICNDIYADNELCINRLVLEIKNYQDTNSQAKK